MSERDELIEAIWKVETQDFGGYSNRDAASVADALIVAGWQKKTECTRCKRSKRLHENPAQIIQPNLVAERLGIAEPS